MRKNPKIMSFPSPVTRETYIPLRAATVRRGIDLIARSIDIARLTELANHDPGFAFQLLRLANHRIDPTGTRIYRLGEAIFFADRDGLKQILRPVILPPQRDFIESVGAHSRLTALLARRLALITSNCDPERAYIAGLLHDVGELAASQHSNPGSHCALGRELADHSMLPLFIKDAISNHHRPRAAEYDPELVMIVSVADQIAQGLAWTSNADRTSTTEILRSGIALFKKSDPEVLSDFTTSTWWFPTVTHSRTTFGRCSQ